MSPTFITPGSVLPPNGGAQSVIQRASLDLTSAEILHLYYADSPVDIVAAQGIGAWVYPVAYAAKFTPGSTPYTGVAISFAFGWPIDPFGPEWGSSTNLNGFLNSASSAFQYDLIASATSADAFSAPNLYGDNSPLYVSFREGNPAAGDGTLNIELLYTVFGGS